MCRDSTILFLFIILIYKGGDTPISKHNFIPEISEAIKQYESIECDGEAEQGEDKLFHLLFNNEGSTVTSETELNALLDVAEMCDIPVYDVISGKVDLDVLKFLGLRIVINREIDDLPTVDEDKKAKKNKKAIDKAKRKSKAEQGNLIDFKKFRKDESENEEGKDK